MSDDECLVPVDDGKPRLERLTFFVSAPPERTRRGWLVTGEPGFAPALWARPGDVFDEVASPSQGLVHAVHLVVLELGPTSVVLTGDDGAHLVAGDIVSGERMVHGAPTGAAPPA